MLNKLFGNQSVDSIMAEFTDTIARLKSACEYNKTVAVESYTEAARLTDEAHRAENEARRAEMIAQSLSTLIEGNQNERQVNPTIIIDPVDGYDPKN